MLFFVTFFKYGNYCDCEGDKLFLFLIEIWNNNIDALIEKEGTTFVTE